MKLPSMDLERYGRSHGLLWKVGGMLALITGIYFATRNVSRPTQPGAATSPYTALLAQNILAPKQTDSELKRYLDAKVLDNPKASNAAEWNATADGIRKEVLEKVIFRDNLSKSWRDGPTKVEWGDTIPGGPGYHIRKLKYEILPDMWAPAVLYMPDNVTGKIPVHLAVNGHEPVGKAAPFKQLRCINLAKRGVASLNVEWIGMGQLMSEDFAHHNIKYLEVLGVSGLAPFYLSLSRALDVLTSLPVADTSRVAVSGLSGGGWQTIFISALDKRITAANPVAGYSRFKTRIVYPADIGDAEQVATDLGSVAGYSHLTALMAGRDLLLTYNSKDNCCFRADYALPPLLEAADPIFKLYDNKTIRFHRNEVPGTHNFEVDNREAFYRFIGDVFFPGDPTYSAKEIPSDTEVKQQRDLETKLPKNNVSLYQLAIQTLKSMPTPPSPRRERLREIIKYEPLSLSVRSSSEKSVQGTRVVSWNMDSNGAWGVPITEFTQGIPRGTTILLADKGRGSLASQVEQLLSQEQRVLAVDLIGFGESSVGSRHRPTLLLVPAMGSRLLGIQSGELLAVAQWTKNQFGQVPDIATYGPRGSLVAMVAKALEPKSLANGSYDGNLESLNEAIYKRFNYADYPESFCFGLLKEFDTPQLQQLANEP